MASVRARQHWWWCITQTIVLQWLVLTSSVVSAQQSSGNSGGTQAAQHSRSEHDFVTVLSSTSAPVVHYAKPEQATDLVGYSDNSEVVGSSRSPYSEIVSSSRTNSNSDVVTSETSPSKPVRNISSPAGGSAGISTAVGGGPSVLSLVHRGSSSSSSRGDSISSSRSSRDVGRPSLLGTMLLLLITLVVSISLVVMLICFITKWRDNMNTARYPSVMYSMLRQGEDEPEDVMGEILINIGLASSVEEQTTDDSEEDDSNHDDDDVVDVCALDGSQFTSIPLQAGEETERSHLLAAQHQEESDEELLQ